MKDIASIYNHPFPDDQVGNVIDGIDLQMLASDSLRLIDAFGKQGGEFSLIQAQVFQSCLEEAKIVSQKCDKHVQPYFLGLLKLLESVESDNLKNNVKEK